MISLWRYRIEVKPSLLSFRVLFLTISWNMELRIPKDGEERYQWQKLETTAEMLRRAEILQKADKDKEFRAALWEMCRRDIVFFVDNFCWIYEPRPGMEHNQPWHIYPHEIRQIDWMEERFKNREDGLIEKSREMGASWTFCVWLIHHFLFDEEFSALIGSRVEDLVDNKLPDSIFGKLDYILKYIPSWLRPQGFEFDKHRLYMKITNPTNHNALTGESANSQFSRSGRYSCIILDEFAFVDKSYSIWQAAADSSPVRFPISTPNGKGNKFGELALTSDIKKLTLHWTLHPEKDQAWYEREKARRTDQEVAQELDISYDRSTRGRVYQTEWEELRTAGRLTDCPYDPLFPVYTSWDFGIGDATAIGFYQVNRAGAIHMIDYYENTGLPIDHYIKVVQGKPYRYFQHYGDITIRRNELGTGRSVWEILKQNGIFIRGKVLRNKDDAINATKMILRKLYVDKKLTQFIDAIENYHYEWDETKQIFHEIPVHDWSCVHPDTKVRTLRGWEPISTVKPGTWVWSYDQTTHRLVPKQCGFVGQTRKQVETVEIGLDSGKSIICTPDHKLMMRDESWIEAGELKPGDSLMPFYEVLNRGYLQIDLNDGTFADEHKYVFSSVHGPYDQTKHVDHINGNKHDNDPSNLQLLTHQDHVSKTFRGVSPSERHLVAKTPNDREVYGRDRLWRLCGHCGREYFGSYKTWYCSKHCLGQRRRKRDVIRMRQARNHKVRFAKPGPVTDVWDMEVPGTHSFIAEGVVIHNSHACDQISYFAINWREYEDEKPRQMDQSKYKHAITTY